MLNFSCALNLECVTARRKAPRLLKSFYPARWWYESVVEWGDCVEVVGLGDGPLPMNISLRVWSRESLETLLPLEQIVWHADLSKLFFLSSPLGSSVIILSYFYFRETLFLKQSASGPDFSIFFSLLSNFFDKITSLSCPFVYFC